MKKLLFLLPILSLFSFEKEKLADPIKKYLKAYAKIPEGEAFIKQSKIHVEEFYISKTETTNQEYVVFLEDIKITNPELYQKSLPDTTVWASKENVNQGFVNTYLRHPGFRISPVVGVSYTQAESYCKWIETKLNENLNEGLKVKVSLPTEAEWVRAARGDEHTKIFTWGGPYLQDSKGRALANFKKENIKYLNELITSAPERNLLTTSVFSFAPNKFGVYQMCGNVAELTKEPDTIKGGAWDTSADELQIDAKNDLKAPSKSVGFRIAVKKL